MTIDPTPVTVTVPAAHATWARHALSEALHSNYPWDDEQREGIIAVENALAVAVDEALRNRRSGPEPATSG